MIFGNYLKQHRSISLDLSLLKQGSRQKAPSQIEHRSPCSQLLKSQIGVDSTVRETLQVTCQIMDLSVKYKV